MAVEINQAMADAFWSAREVYSHSNDADVDTCKRLDELSEVIDAQLSTPEPSRGAAVSMCLVHVNRQRMDIPAGTVSQTWFRQTFGIPETHDLWQVVPAAQDRKIDGDVDIFNGLRVFSLPRIINNSSFTAEPPAVDVVTIPRELAARAADELEMISREPSNWVASVNQPKADAAAIRALLEPHDAAIDDSGRVVIDRARFDRLADVVNAAREWESSDNSSNKAEGALLKALQAIKDSDLEPLP